MKKVKYNINQKVEIVKKIEQTQSEKCLQTHHKQMTKHINVIITNVSLNKGRRKYVNKIKKDGKK